MSRILALIVLAVVVACASAQYYAASPYYGGVGVYGRSAYAAPLAYSAGYGAVGSPYAYSALNRGVYFG